MCVHVYVYGSRFVGVCSAVVPSRAGFPALADGTTVGWGADYKWFVMLRSSIPALTPPRIIAHAGARSRRPLGVGASGLEWVAPACHTSGPPGRVLRGTCRSLSRACIISLSQTSGCVGWVAHRLLVSCSVLGVAVKPVLLTYLLT